MSDRLTLFEFAARVGVSPLVVVSWTAEGCPCLHADGTPIADLTPAQKRTTKGLGARICAAETEADLAVLCMELEALAAKGHMPRSRALAVQEGLSDIAAALRSLPLDEDEPRDDEAEDFGAPWSEEGSP